MVQMPIGDQRGTDQFGLTNSLDRYIGGEVPAWIMKNCGKLVQHTPPVVERGPVAASRKVAAIRAFEVSSEEGRGPWTDDIPKEVRIKDDSDVKKPCRL